MRHNNDNDVRAKNDRLSALPEATPLAPPHERRYFLWPRTSRELLVPSRLCHPRTTGHKEGTSAAPGRQAIQRKHHGSPSPPWY